MSDSGEAAAASRPRLNLKPRDESAAKQLELQRTASGKNPFGDAKPREAVLASRTGKSETEILVEEVKSEKPKLRLNAAQLEEKRAAEAAVEEVQELIAGEETEAGKAPLREELAARQTALDELMAGFEKLALEAAVKGEFVRPSERRRQQQMLLESQGSLGNGYGTGDPSYRAPEGYRGGGGGGGGLARQGSGGGYGGGAGGGGYDRGGGYAGRGGSYREGGYDRRGGGGGGYGGRGGYGGPRGFSGYEERPGLEDEGRRGSGGYYDREGGGRGGYEARDYRGPSDYDNVETFGTGAAGYGRDRMRGRGGGGRGGGGGGGGGGRSYGTGSFNDEVDYVSPYAGGAGAGDVQDRY